MIRTRIVQAAAVALVALSALLVTPAVASADTGTAPITESFTWGD